MTEQDKYMATVENRQGKEIVCTLSPKTEIGTIEEVQAFLETFTKRFPENVYHTYYLEEIL